MEQYNYAPLADERNQEILRRIKDNDPSFDRLWICSMNYGVFHPSFNGDKDRSYIITGDDIEQLGWLGYYIGQNTSLQELYFFSISITDANFYMGLKHNKSIRKIGFRSDSVDDDGEIFRMLTPFLKDNHNITEFDMDDCDVGAEGIRQLSLALGSFKSLKRIELSHIRIGDGQLIEIILALSMHPQLEVLELPRMGIGRAECTAMATLLRNTTKQLQTLYLHGNNIDDDGLESLVHVIGGSNLVKLNLSSNRSITTRGWEILSNLLEVPAGSIEDLDISDNNLGDGDALIFANAMVANSKLIRLDLSGSDITNEGWAHFSKLLCDTSSVNKTYLSNHTLSDLGTPHLVPAGTLFYLFLNRSSENKGQIAMSKILRHHSHFSVQPFFEWEFKVLPLVVDWLEKAAACTNGFDEKISKMKLSCIYDFVREFPMLYIEPVTRKEIEECSAMEEQLLGDDPIRNESQLEEVKKCKTRAMRRLF